MGKAARAKKRARASKQALQVAGTKTVEKAAKTRTKVEEPENFIQRAVRFLKEVKIEAKKITWPDKKQVFASTLMVLAFSLFVGGYLGLLDVIYNAIISFLVR